MAVIRLQDIALDVRLGVLPEEQVSNQTVHLDLDVRIDASRAAASDRLDDTVNYIDIVEAARAVAGRSPYHLVETLVGRVLEAVRPLPGVLGVRARVRKNHLPGLGGVSHVELEDGDVVEPGG